MTVAEHIFAGDLSREQEIVEERRTYSKLFNLGGAKRRVVTSVAPLHYDNAGSLDEIDLSFVNGEMLLAGHSVRRSSVGVGYEIDFKNGSTGKVELVAIDGAAPDFSGMTVREDGSLTAYTNVAPDLNMELRANFRGAEIFKIVKTDTAPRRFDWRVTRIKNDTQSEYRHRTLGNDASRHHIEMQNEVLNIQDEPGGKESFIHQEVWTGRVSKVADKVTRIREWTTPEFPVRIDADFTGTTTDANDGMSRQLVTTGGTTTNWTASGGTLNLKHVHNPTTTPTQTTDWFVGLRFVSVSIPVGATVDDSTLKLYTKSDATGNTAWTIKGYDVADPSMFNGTSVKLRDVSKTTASIAGINIDDTSGNVNSFNAKAIVTELTPLTAGPTYAFAFALSHTIGTNTNTVAFAANEHASITPPTLDINYTVGFIPQVAIM